ncbi:MAG TPA: hybrid sensor histidine kinase/response regulator [Armatimonadetes bacterium]|jgi:K+-sensing histidine kinase KdpD|nr:hybrid sensor histidine kinase/response regulator [Armatimonadota bacterium]
MGQFRILLVEDDTDLRAIMRRHLAGRGYHIDEAESVVQACGILDQAAHQLLILDIDLPDGSGWEVARYARGCSGAQLPVVICSSHEPSAVDLQEENIQGYLRKPFDHHVLIERVEAALGAVESTFMSAAQPCEADDIEVAFYSSLAHDMRTPMTTLRTAIESLLADDVEWDAETRREFLEVVACSAERVGKYARDVIDLARLDAGAMRPHLQVVHPDEIHEALTRVLHTRRPAPLVTLSVASGTTAVLGDPGLIQRILLEVIDNALRCSPEGAEVAVEASGAAGEVWWRVRDFGPGIVPEERERVFDRHHRMHGRNRATSRGPHLSLYLCREMARLQAGRLWVEETEGTGACFCLALPSAVGK